MRNGRRWATGGRRGRGGKSVKVPTPYRITDMLAHEAESKRWPLLSDSLGALSEKRFGRPQGGRELPPARLSLKLQAQDKENDVLARAAQRGLGHRCRVETASLSLLYTACARARMQAPHFQVHLPLENPAAQRVENQACLLSLFQLLGLLSPHLAVHRSSLYRRARSALARVLADRSGIHRRCCRAGRHCLGSCWRLP